MIPAAPGSPMSVPRSRPVRGRSLVLVVDDEVRSQETLRRTLDEAFDVVTVSGAAEAEALLQQESPQVILCDQRMPGETGVAFLRRVRDQWPDPIRILLSGYTEAPDLIRSINEAGVHRFISKPWEPEALIRQIHEAVRLFHLQRDNDAASHEMRASVTALAEKVRQKRRTLKDYFDFDHIIRGPDSPLDEICSLVKQIARYDIAILITGETGTGKELLARAIHYSSPRAERAFVVQNCGALPDPLLESELFGSRRGAYTGAYEDRTGLFERADGGTIFLDEIGDTSLAFQVKLLRVLQEGEIRPLGASRTRHVDVRVIAATNRDLDAEVAAGRFRGDLYYRLAAFPVSVPPLRDRAMDLDPLLAHLIAATGRAFGKSIQGCAPEVRAALTAYPWPGNVRELQNEVQRMVALAEQPVLGAGLLSPRLRAGLTSGIAGENGRRTSDSISFSPRPGQTLKAQLDALEAAILKEALERHRGNISRAAEELGLSRLGLRGKLRRVAPESAFAEPDMDAEGDKPDAAD